MAADRSPEEIRASLEQHRGELGEALERLRGELREVTDWRRQLRENRQQVLVAAAVAGFVLGGGIGGFFSLFSRS